MFSESHEMCVWGRRAHMLLALDIRPLTTYPFRDGAPFLLLLIVEKPPSLGRSVRFFHKIYIKKTFLLILSRASLAVCGHHLSPINRIAIVFSLPSNVPNFSMAHPSVFLISSRNTFRFSLYNSPSPTTWVLLSSALPQGRLCARLLPPPPPDCW